MFGILFKRGACHLEVLLRVRVHALRTARLYEFFINVFELIVGTEIGCCEGSECGEAVAVSELFMVELLVRQLCVFLE